MEKRNKTVYDVVREIKQGYRELGVEYNKDMILDTLIRLYGFKTHQIEGLKL